MVVIIVAILGYMGYYKYIIEPTETEASNELAFPRAYFDQSSVAPPSEVDSLQLGLDGADGKYGFLDIAEMYSGTKAGNIANYYAGVSYLKLKDYENAIDFLSQFDSDDDILGPTALGAIGDVADIDQEQEALEYYEKAAYKKENALPPLYSCSRLEKQQCSWISLPKQNSFFKKLKMITQKQILVRI